jgi:hypothetical protein
MKCRCIESFKINDFIWEVGQVYEYTTNTHEETGFIIYSVHSDSLYLNRMQLTDSLPMMEDKFRKRFDDREELREKKLKQLFNETNENS